MAFHWKDQPAADILERQDVDTDHRAVEREHVERKQRGQRIEGPRPGAAARRDGATSSRHGQTIEGGERIAHWVISRRMSTERRISETMAIRISVSSTALAAAVGYCSTPTSS